MRISGRGWAFFGAVLAALAIGAVFAYADTVNGDGDIVKPNNNLSYTPSANFTEHCSDRGAAVAGVATIKFNGGATTGRAPHYDPGATVTVTDVPDAAGAAAGITASGGTGTVPDPWDTEGQTFTAPLTTTVPLTVPNGTYTMTVTASGPAHDSHGVALTHETSDTYTVSVACPNSAPSPAWVAHPSSANEGDTKTYSFAITDPDSTSWTYPAGYPSCGANGTLSGTPSIDSTAKTGTFDCTFPNGPASSTVAAEVSDGTDTSSELDQTVAVANVAPSVSFTSAPANAFEGGTKTYAFSVGDPGATDTYGAATGTPDCGAHGSYVAGSLTLSGTSGSQTGSFQCSFAVGPSSTTVSIAFTDSDGSTGAPATADVVVQDAPLTAGAFTVSNGVEGVTASNLSFAFTDANPGAVAGDYTATITWGDGVTSSGTVASAAGGGFTVSGSHTYAEEGDLTASASVLDVGGSTTSGSGTAHVADAALTAGALTIGAGVEGVTASNLSFAFTDANPGAPVADFTATINWGDGVTSSGTLSSTAGGFSVAASHTYAAQGTFTVGVTVNDDGGSSAVASGSAHVADAQLTPGTLTISDGVEGATASNLSFAFTDANPSALPNQTVSINWGDGQTTAGTVSAGPTAGTFVAAGSHVFADEGTFHATVTVTGSGGTSMAVGHGDAKVADAPLTAGTLTIGNGAEGVTASQLSFTFTDANPAAPASDFTGTINWGDGHTTNGTVTASAGGFVLSASHSYGEEGTFSVSVRVADVGGSTATATGSATVADAPLTAGSLVLPSFAVRGIPTGLVFNFHDANTAAPRTEFTATINWGDGSTSSGLVLGAGGSFVVAGLHIYTSTGPRTVTVTVLDHGGSTTSASDSILSIVTCPSHGSINVRFHYSANGSAGGWSATRSTDCSDASLAIGPQAMEGDLKVNPGTTIKTGYDFTLPGNHTAFTALAINPRTVFQVRCVSGAAPTASTFTVSMANQTYPVTGDAWYPSGDQSSPLVYQGSATVPDLCRGGQLRLDRGATFSASIVLF